MRKIVLALIFVLSVCSCDILENDNERYEYNYFENSELNIEQFPDSYMKQASISEGNKIVFNYQYHFDEDARAYDGGYSDYIYFEINSDIDNFELTGEELVNTNVIFTKSCFCYFSDSPEKNVEPKGTILGEKISANRWRINLNVTFYGDENKNFEGIFVLKEN